MAEFLPQPPDRSVGRGPGLAGPAGHSRGSRRGEPRSRRGTDAEKADRVDALFAPWSPHRMPGAAVCVIRGGRVVHRKEYGSADRKTPLGPRSAFLLCSLTKSFTAMAVMILAEQRQLTYKDSLAHFFPQFPAYARAITIRHLLNHTAGLPEYDELFVDQGKIDTDWPRSVHTAPSKYEPTARDTLALLAGQKDLLFPPGERFCYSNSGYVVLGQIIEKVAGECYAKFLTRAIFRPLGMDHSLVYDESKPKVPNRATSYTWSKGNYHDIDYTPLNLIYGPDGVYSTIEDMARWDDGLTPGKLVQEATLAQAFAPGKLKDGSPTSYGFGWFVGDRDVWHNGKWLGFRSYMIRFPKERFTVIVLANCAELNADCLGDDVVQVYATGRA